MLRFINRDLLLHFLQQINLERPTQMREEDKDVGQFLRS